MSVLGTDFGKSGKECGLKLDSNIVPYEEQDGRPAVVGSVRISTTGVTNPDKFQGRLHGLDLNLGTVSAVIVLNTVVVQKDSFHIPNPYEFH